MIAPMFYAAVMVSGGAVGLGGPAYTIDTFTIDGGGGTSSGGVYTLSGTIGQHDAAAPTQGGAYTLTGGFWGGVQTSPSPCNAADLAEPFGVLDLADINVFVSGFVTQDPAADLDDNGIFDLADIGAFVGSFTAGCP